MDIKSTIRALDQYAKSNPHSKNERHLLKLTIINGEGALQCIPEDEISLADRLKSLLGFGDYKLRKIAAFLSSDKFCTAVKETKLEDKDIQQLKKATEALSIGIDRHNNKIWFLRWAIDKNLDRLTHILDAKVSSVANPIINKSQTSPQSQPTAPPPLTKAQAIIKQLESSKKLSLVEQQLISTLQPALAPNDAIKAQAKALQALTPQEQNDDDAISRAKQRALLDLCKLTDTYWVEALEALEAAVKEAEPLIPPPQTPNTSKIPELAHNQIQHALSQHVRLGMQQVLDENITALTKKETSFFEWKADVAKLASRVQEYVGIFQEALQPRYDFYNKWGPYLQAEMIQGFKDPGETLGGGICWALSLRWCIAELEKSATVDAQDMVTEMKIGTSDARDRFNQAFLKVIQSGEAINSPELENLKKRHNIAKTHRFDWGENIQNSELGPLLKTHLTDNTFIANQGVGQLCFWWQNVAHAISICCQPDNNDPQKSVFRISDPNIGTFHIPVPPSHYQHTPTLNRYIECLTELLTTFYSHTDNLKKLSCFHFEQSRPPVVEE